VTSRRLASLLVLTAFGLLAAEPAGAGLPATLIQLKPAAACTEAVGLVREGARPVDVELRLWRLPGSVAGRAVPSLRSRHALAFAQREQTYRVEDEPAPEPLQGDEWWRSQIGIDGLTPPGPGVPITIVDTGIDVSHPEFAGRADLLALNAQEPAGLGGEHGTMVASVIGAPVNGVGIVGIYPRAAIRSWDVAKGAGRELDSTEISGGILAAARAGRSVINLSVGGTRDLAVELAIAEAVAKGSLVVASSGNDGERGNSLSYPAVLPHVTTVAATERSGGVASFSSRSPFVDLAAPGDEILVASALGKDWRVSSGTSFSSPLVAGAAAWIWTVRPELTAGQVAEILRRSARDIAPTGRDQASGFGALDVRAALDLPAPVRDPFEPNDDIDEVSPNGDRFLGQTPPLTTATRRSSRVVATVDAHEDPRDVYRIWLPARSQVTATLRSAANADLALYGASAPTVSGRFASTGRLATAATAAQPERLRFHNTGKGRWAYVVVNLPSGTVDATYRLDVAATRPRV
jgi:hypothetical protein